MGDLTAPVPLLSRDSFGANAVFAAQEALDQRHLAADLGLAAFFPRALHQLALAMAQLFRQAFGHDVDGLVEFVTVVLGMEVGSAQGEMDFDHESMFEGAFIIVPKGDVGTDQIQSEVFKAFDLLSDIRMNGRSKLNITRADMNLHVLKLHSG